MELVAELMPRRSEVDHDWQTISTYADHVAVECTCGYHAPPVGLSENPKSHVEDCAFRTNRNREAKNINQLFIEA